MFVFLLYLLFEESSESVIICAMEQFLEVSMKVSIFGIWSCSCFSAFSFLLSTCYQQSTGTPICLILIHILILVLRITPTFLSHPCLTEYITMYLK